MQTREIQREISLDVSVERAFNLLITPSEIRQWWLANRAIVLPKAGGTWAAAWGDDEDGPDYVTCAKIVKYDPPSVLCLAEYEYFSKDGGLPFEADFEVEFEVQSRDSTTILKITQRGFPADESADAFFSGCQKGWDDTLASMQKFLASTK